MDSRPGAFRRTQQTASDLKAGSRLSRNGITGWRVAYPATTAAEATGADGKTRRATR